MRRFVSVGGDRKIFGRLDLMAIEYVVRERQIEEEREKERNRAREGEKEEEYDGNGR